MHVFNCFRTEMLAGISSTLKTDFLIQFNCSILIFHHWRVKMSYLYAIAIYHPYKNEICWSCLSELYLFNRCFVLSCLVLSCDTPEKWNKRKMLVTHQCAPVTIYMAVVEKNLASLARTWPEVFENQTVWNNNCCHSITFEWVSQLQFSHTLPQSYRSLVQASGAISMPVG